MSALKEFRKELKGWSDEELRKEHSNASHSITRGSLMSRAGVNACLKFMAEIEREQKRRKESK
jgi:hypothetical protein